MAEARAELQVVRVGPAELARVAPLFDAYRRFTGEPADLAASQRFLAARVARGESVIFLALLAPDAAGGELGFVQLYPSFASATMARILLLSDLFVWPDARRRGVGRALLARARDHARAAGVRRLDLRAARANVPARSLYESCGYAPNRAYTEYTLRI